MGKVRRFFSRAKFAWVNARRSTKQFKRDGIVFLPNGSVLVDPRKSLYGFGYEVVSTSSSRHGYGEDEDDDEYYEED